MNKIDLGSMSRAEMEAYVRSIGEPAFAPDRSAPGFAGAWSLRI